MDNITIVLSFIGTLLGFWLVAFLIGMLRQYRSSKTWLKPDKAYLFNLFNSWSYVIYAMSGRQIPSTKRFIFNRKVAKVPQSVIDDCLSSACKMMLDMGARYSAYKVDQFDCDAFARLMISLATLQFRKHPDSRDGGAPIFLFCYTTERNTSHACVETIDDNGSRRFWQPYPDAGRFRELNLSQREIDSCNLEM